MSGCTPARSDPADGDGQRLGERRGDRVDAVGDRGQVLERRVDQLGEAAVAAEPDAGAGPAAEVGAARAAERARAAGDVRRHRVPHVGEARRPVDDDAGQLVAGRRAERPPEVTVPEVEVGAADAARLDAQPHPARRQRAGLARPRSRARRRSRWRGARPHRRPIGSGPPPGCDDGASAAAQEPRVTERKPFGVSWETWIDRQIREGMERGEFDGLPGHGKPIQDVDRPHDELWWVRDKLRREGVSYLPPTLALRKDVEDARAAIDEATTEAEVRQIVDEINERIRSVNRLATAGPPSNLMPLDVDRTLDDWRAARS